MKKLTPEQVNKEIDRRNKLFEGKTNAEKRVLIAKDVIAQIRAKKFIPAHVGFVLPEEDGTLDTNSSAQEALISDQVSFCRCCGVGAMFLSCTIYNNNVVLGDILGDNYSLGNDIEFNMSIPNGLNKFFSRNQLMLVEQAYETGEGFFWENQFKGKSKAIAFGEKYKDSKKRLIAIMKNIITNKGKFVP